MNHKFLSMALAASMMVTSAVVPVFATTEEQPVATDTSTPDQNTGDTENQETNINTPAADQGDETEEGTSDESGETVDQPEQPSENPNPAEDSQPSADTGADAESDSSASETEKTEETSTENPADEEGNDDTRDRDGTDVTVGLKTDTLVDGTKMSKVVYQPGKPSYDVQVGGQLTLTSVWSNYSKFKTLYTIKNGKEKFRSKFLKGSWEYVFHVNPDVVDVNTDILCNPVNWQTAFEQGSGEKAAGFFQYMKCSEVTYDPSGKVTVRFTINENGTGKVSMITMEDVAGTRPNTIEAYSPAGAFTIPASKFVNGADAVPEVVSFKGEIDLDPWMALVFPIRFDTEISHQGTTLEIPDAKVAFNVENGTWADGSTDTKFVNVPVNLIENGLAAAGTLSEDLVPTDMIAAEGYDQKKGSWSPELNLKENGVILAVERNEAVNSAVYTYSFSKVEPPKPEEPKPQNRKNQNQIQTSHLHLPNLLQVLPDRLLLRLMSSPALVLSLVCRAFPQQVSGLY